MPKGCCGGGSCSCQMIGRGAIDISGSGQPSDPFILDVDLNLGSSSNKTFNVIIEGDGTTADPYEPVVSFADTAQLDDLPDVEAPNPTNGQVLAWNAGTQRWVPVAPTTAPAGAVSHDTSLAGDGSAGSPLGVLTGPTRRLGSFTDGIGVTDAGLAEMVQHYVDSTARNTAIPSPTLNQMTILDTSPGVINYWTGTAWSVLPNQTSFNVINGEFLALSGPYSAGLPVTILTKQINTTTDGTGLFDMLDTVDLTGYSGILGIQLTEMGSIPWKAMLNPVSNEVQGTAYRLSDGTILAGTPITAVALAVLY